MQQRQSGSTSVVLVEKVQACLFDQQRCVLCGADGAAPMTMGGCSMRGWEGGGRWEMGGGRVQHEEA